LTDAAFKLVLLDEVNVALRKDYVSVEQVLDGIERRPANTHVVLTGRNAPDELIERADLVTRDDAYQTSAEAQESSCTGRDRVLT